MSPEILAAWLLSAVPSILKKGTETLAGAVLKDGWDAVKARIGPSEDSEAASQIEAGEIPTPAMQAQVAAILTDDPQLAQRLDQAREQITATASGGIAIGQIHSSEGSRVNVVDTINGNVTF